MNVIESKIKIIDPDQPLPKLVMKVGTLISAINAKNIEAIGSVAYVPIANNEFAFTRFSLSTNSGTTDSRDGCLIKENISVKKLMINKCSKLLAKKRNKTITIRDKSVKIIIFFLFILSAISPANEDRNAGIILAITGTTAVIPELPFSEPSWLASATDANNVAQSPKLESDPDHHKIENCDFENILILFTYLYTKRK